MIFILLCLVLFFLVFTNTYLTCIDTVPVLKEKSMYDIRHFTFFRFTVMTSVGTLLS